MAHIFRKEMKYIVTIESFLRIQRLLQSVLQPDEHGVDGAYMVRSQYYDSLTDADLQDNLDGVMEKRKVRIRIYSTDATMAKLEYKCKTGTDGVKLSLNISREEVLQMENGEYGFLLDKKEPLALELYNKMTEQVYMPKTIIEYDRTAYTYPVSDVRVTFDRNLRATVNPYGIFEENPFYLPLLSPDMGILEVKYNDFFPDVLKPMVKSIEDVSESYSKYSNSRIMYM